MNLTSILGISAFYHDAAAALVVDGEIVLGGTAVAPFMYPFF